MARRDNLRSRRQPVDPPNKFMLALDRILAIELEPGQAKLGNVLGLAAFIFCAGYALSIAVSIATDLIIIVCLLVAARYFWKWIYL